MSRSTAALIAVPFFTGAIGYVTNWTGVLMLFYPVRFRGWRAPWLRSLAHVLPYRLQQIPGIMVGGIGWQGIVPSRAAKMGSLAVDVGIAKLGTPREFFDRLEPEKIAEHIATSLHSEIRPIVDRVMEREQPRLWRELPRAIRELVYTRVEQQLPEIVQRADRSDRRAHRAARRRQADGDPALRPRSSPTGCSSTWVSGS